MTLSAERLRELVDYNAETGEMRWRIDRGGSARAGCTVGSVSLSGYLKTAVDDRRYQVHRLVWLYVFGEWPKRFLDHINGNRADNRLCNLRSVDGYQNACNRGVQRDNTSGFKGVSWHKKSKKWRATISVRGKYIHLGVFPTKEAAANAYAKASEQHHGDFGRV